MVCAKVNLTVSNNKINVQNLIKGLKQFFFKSYEKVICQLNYLTVISKILYGIFCLRALIINRL